MSFADAVEMPIAQLKLVAGAAVRKRARDSLDLLQVTMAGVAACMTKEGQRLAKKLEKELRELSSKR